MLVHPGPAYSVADVYNGWLKALRGHGIEVEEYDLGQWLWFLSNSHLEHAEQGWVPALDAEMSAWVAGNLVKASMFSWWPDVVFVVSGFFMSEHVVQVARARGMRVVWLMTESPYEDDRQLQRAGWGADLIVLNDPTNLDRFRQVNSNTIYLPHSYDPEVHYPGSSSRRSDVAIVGTGFPSRVAWLEQMDWSGIDLALLGNWASLEGHPLASHVHQAQLEECCDNATTADWYRGAKASLNLYRVEAERPELSAGFAMGPREVELAACGTWFCTQPRHENRKILPMLPAAETPAEAEDAIRWALKNDRHREAAAERARRAVEGWTFANRAGEVLRLLDRQPVTV